MNVQIPMDVFVHIIKQSNKSGGESLYFARLTIGRPDLRLEENSEEAYFCGAVGKSFFACIASIKERALLWAEREGVGHISGLVDNEPCPLTLRTPHEEIEVVPVTYNDWFAKPAHL